MTDRELHSLPSVGLELIDDEVSSAGFLELHRARYRTRHADGRTSREFVYDSVRRRALDAVVIAAHFRRGDDHWVYLRSALRPPVSYRQQIQTPDTEPPSIHFWELPAGLVEPGEQTVLGLKEAAARETLEELGFDLNSDAFTPLGPGTYPTPAVIAERQFYFRVPVDPLLRGVPQLDGSPLEASGVVVEIKLDHALQLCRDGKILDGKTEIGLRRLAEIVRDVD